MSEAFTKHTMNKPSLAVRQSATVSTFHNSFQKSLLCTELPAEVLSDAVSTSVRAFFVAWDDERHSSR